MKISLRAPSKTFLMGEYLALGGGPSLVLNTKPYFTMNFSAPGEGLCQGVNPQSPAGQWIRQDNFHFRTIDGEFIDPHEQKGGFGASTSQFLLAFAYSNFRESSWDKVYNETTLKRMWHEYRQVAWTEKGPLPSGADLIGQFTGGVTEFRSQPFSVKEHAWPFKDIGFAIIRTGNKAATHEHLQSLDEKVYADMRETGEEAVAAFVQGDWSLFSQSLNEYYGLLCEKHLICEESRKIVKKLIAWPMVKAAKACGALGADTILTFSEAQRVPEMVTKLQGEGFEVVATNKDITSGLDFHIEKGEQKDVVEANQSSEDSGDANV